MVVAICVDLEHHAIIIGASNFSRPIQGSVTSLNDTGINIGTITAIEAMEHLEFGAIGVDLEHHAIIIGASSFGRPIQSSIIPLNDTVWTSAVGVGSIKGVLCREGIKNLEFGAVRVDLEYDTTKIGASR